MKRAHLLSVIVAAAAIAGCATRPPPVRQPQSRPVAPARVQPAPLSPADYLAISASRSLLLVRAAELAAARDPGLAQEAGRIAAGHRGIAAQLNFAGRRLDLLPPAELLPGDRVQLEALERSADVGSAWRQVVAAGLARCDRHEADYAERGTSPTLRPVARFALGVCREELARLR